MDQLDEERMFENPVMPRTMILQMGSPQVTDNFGPSYPFTDPRQRLGATSRGQGPNNMA